MNNNSILFFRGLYDNTTDTSCKSFFSSLSRQQGKIADIDVDALLKGKDDGYASPTGDTIDAPKDYRLLSLEVRNFRMFPFDRDKPYGLDLSNVDAEPCSLFLIGDNGTGKSSLYTALEYAMTSHSSYAERGGKSEADYLPYSLRTLLQEDRQSWSVEARSKSGQIFEGGNVGMDSVRSIFTSECDIEQFERTDDNLYDYFLQAMGYDEVLDILERLSAARNKKLTRLGNLKEVRENHQDVYTSEDVELLKTSIIRISAMGQKGRERLCRFFDEKALESEISAMKDGKSHLKPGSELFDLLWIRLRKNIKQEAAETLPKKMGLDTRAASPSSGVMLSESERIVNRLKWLYSQLKRYSMMIKSPDGSVSLSKTAEVLDMLGKESNLTELSADIFWGTGLDGLIAGMDEEVKILASVTNLIKKSCDDIVAGFVKEYGSFIEGMMTDFSIVQNCQETFRFTHTSGWLGLSISLSEKTGNISVAPREYLNTFRFKLYATSFRLAMALSHMKDRRIYLPVVIDDIFSASDFDNGNKLELFVYSLYRLYADQPEFCKPLQLVLFTHDEVVFNAFRRGASLKKSSDTVLQQNGTMRKLDTTYQSGRLYPYWKSVDVRDENEQKKTANYYNLYLRFR